MGLTCAALLCVLPGCSASLNIGGETGSDGPVCSAVTRPASERLGGPLVLAAQSVPGAALVPCLRPLPAGWTFREVHSQRGRTRVVLDFGRNDVTAMTITLVRHCDISGVDEVASDQPRARRYETVHETASRYRSDRYYVFTGGCVRYRFDIAGTESAEPAARISRAVRLLDRDRIRKYVQAYGGSRLALDPSPSGSR